MVAGSEAARSDARIERESDVSEDDRDRADAADVGEASEALRRFLAGFGLDVDAVTASRTGDWCCRAAAARRDHPQADLAALAVAEAEADLARWFEAVVGTDLIGDQPPVRVGRAAFLLSGAGRRWPGCLLSREPIADEVAAALRGAVPPSTPPAQPATMPEQALEPWTLTGLVAALPRVLLGRAATATS